MCTQCGSLSQCAAQHDACTDDPTGDCVLYYSGCANGCAAMDQACYDNCAAANPGGAALYKPWMLCLVCNACSNDCGAGLVGVHASDCP